MAVHPVPDTHNKSIGELLSDLSYQTRELISEELALAKAEISEKVSRITRSGVWSSMSLSASVSVILFTAAISRMIRSRAAS